MEDRASEMGQQMQEPPANPADRSSNSGTHMLEGRRLIPLVVPLTSICVIAYLDQHTYKHT